MGLQDTPQAERTHIAIYGSVNSGKSTLINMLCTQDVSLVSKYAGTTTDPVSKSIELPGIGPCVLYDTAGFSDDGTLGAMRIERTKKVMEKSDLAILLFDEREDQETWNWYRELQKKQIPTLSIYNTKGNRKTTAFYEELQTKIHKELLCVDVRDVQVRETIIEQLTRLLPSDYKAPSIIGHLVDKQDIVLLVMPQDIQAPKGRLILPQVQTIRDLLDHECIVQCCTPATMDTVLAYGIQPPKLIITDSQIFKEVYEKKPKTSILTSFSVLFARYKGDSAYFVEGACSIAKLGADARILIAEACSHMPMNEDIGRVKLPRMLKKRLGENIQLDIVNGVDFPEDIRNYDLIIHCGACMFHKNYVMRRVEQVKAQGGKMSNYGIVIAYLQGILDKIEV